MPKADQENIKGAAINAIKWKKLKNKTFVQFSAVEPPPIEAV